MPDLDRFFSNNLIGTSEASQILGCSRQYINQLVKDGKLVPVKINVKNRLFLRADVEDITNAK